MRTLKLNAVQMARPIISNYTITGVDTTAAKYTYTQYLDKCYLAFDILADIMFSKIPTQVVFGLYCNSTVPDDGWPQVLSIYPLISRFSEEDSKNLKFPSYTQPSVGSIHLSASAQYNTYTRSSQVEAWSNILKNGMLLLIDFSIPSGRSVNIWTDHSTYVPYLTLTYNEGSLISILDSPTGYIDRTKPNTFRWGLTYEGYPIEAVAQKSATLYWRNGTGGTVNSIPITGAATEYTIPANILPASANLQWRVQATSTANVTTTNTDWQSITTIDAVPVAVAVSPAGTYVDGSRDIRFAWRHEVSTGSPQTRYDLQYKTSVSEWIALKTEYTANTFADVPGSNLPSGTIQWQVRTYNGDGVASAWSNILTAVVIASPAAPTVNIDLITPRPKISWQSSDQQAYQVQMGGYDSGQVFGIDKSFKCPVHLPDGPVTVRVRVLNEYNLWSPWTERVINITNIPGLSMALTAFSDHDTHLSWVADDTASLYWIYRDGVLIAKTLNNLYTDKLAIGTHSYRVRAELTGSDNYTDSNEIATTARTDFPIICALDGEWISLQLSANSNPTTQITMQREVSLLQLSGAVYPVPETAEFMRRSYTIRAAYKDRASASRLESLMGKIVCVKDQYENLMIGIISSVGTLIAPFFVEVTATVDEVDSGEYNAVDIL